MIPAVRNVNIHAPAALSRAQNWAMLESHLAPWGTSIEKGQVMFEGRCDRGEVDAASMQDCATGITVYKANWDRNAWDLLRLRRALRLRVVGPDAAVFRETFHGEGRTQIPWTGITEIDRAMAAAGRRLPRAGDHARRIALSDDELIAAIVAARLLGVAALLALLALCLHAIDCGYRVEMEFHSDVPLPWEQELVFHLTPK
jgi:hypothetical protein